MINSPFPPKILIVDDENLNRKILLDLLSHYDDIIMAKNGTQALDRALELDPDLILLDLVMPDMSGYDVLKKLKQDNRTKDIAVIIVSALDSVDEEALGLKYGALDYITKPFNATVVKARVRNVLKLVQQRKMLEQLADLDSLTRLNNRRKFDEKLNKTWQHCEQERTPISLAFIDVDYFKQFNDLYGHTMGDTVLSHVASVIKSSLDDTPAFCARYGGEEFVVFLPGNGEELCHLAELIRFSVENLEIAHDGSKISDRITVSIGCTSADITNDIAPSDLVEQADKILYEAKKEGRNRVLYRQFSLT